MALRGTVTFSRIGSRFPAIRQSCPSVRVFAPPSASVHRIARSTSERVPWYEKLPMTWRPSFWRSIIPIPLRKKAREARRNARKQQGPKPWNPATFFVVIFMLMGSFGIHFINLRQQYALVSRQAENRIATLREVLRRVQAGEDVDVENLLGTGDPLAELEWEEVMKRIEEEDRLWQSKEQKKARRQARKEAREAAGAAITA